MNEDDALSVNLQNYRKAIEEEYKAGSTGTSDELADLAKTRLALLLPEASETLCSILHTGSKEDAVRLSAVKLVFEYTLGKPVPKTDKESDTDKIIRELMASPSE